MQTNIFKIQLQCKTHGERNKLRTTFAIILFQIILLFYTNYFIPKEELILSTRSEDYRITSNIYIEV